jgi:hypothetical protein
MVLAAAVVQPQLAEMVQELTAVLVVLVQHHLLQVHQSLAVAVAAVVLTKQQAAQHQAVAAQAVTTIQS